MLLDSALKYEDSRIIDGWGGVQEGAYREETGKGPMFFFAVVYFVSNCPTPSASTENFFCFIACTGNKFWFMFESQKDLAKPHS